MFSFIDHRHPIRPRSGAERLCSLDRERETSAILFVGEGDRTSDNSSFFFSFFLFLKLVGTHLGSTWIGSCIGFNVVDTLICLIATVDHAFKKLVSYFVPSGLPVGYFSLRRIWFWGGRGLKAILTACIIYPSILLYYTSLWGGSGIMLFKHSTSFLIILLV